MLIDKKFSEVNPLLNAAGHHVENWQGNPHQKEYLKVYFLVLQVCHFLMAGQVKSVKPCLKQLQQSIQTIMSPNWPSDELVTGPNIGDMFIWMPKEHLYVLVYLVTVMHSMQAGYMEKAQKYTEKALLQIGKLKSYYLTVKFMRKFVGFRCEFTIFVIFSCWQQTDTFGFSIDASRTHCYVSTGYG